MRCQFSGGRILIKLWFLLGVVVAAAVVLAACGSGPSELEFDLVIKERQLDSVHSVLNVKQGDTVTLRITADEVGSVHLEGYDLVQDVSPGIQSSLTLTATEEGEFSIEFQPSAGSAEAAGDDNRLDVDAPSAVFESPLLSTGDSFDFRPDGRFAGATIPFHNQINSFWLGTIRVADSAMSMNTFRVTIGEDGSFFPTVFTVNPGATIRWLNSSSEQQRVVSGLPPFVIVGLSEDEEPVRVLLGHLQVDPK